MYTRGNFRCKERPQDHICIYLFFEKVNLNVPIILKMTLKMAEIGIYEA